MAFTRSPDRPARSKRVSVSSQRDAQMSVGDPIDLRISFGGQTRYQCPPCAVYFKVGSSTPPPTPGGLCMCTKCGSTYQIGTVSEDGSVLSFVPTIINRKPVSA